MAPRATASSWAVAWGGLHRPAPGGLHTEAPGSRAERRGTRCQASAPRNPASLPEGKRDMTYDQAASTAAQRQKGGKLCEGCKAVRALVEFSELATTEDGYHYLCRACVWERQAVRYPDKADIPHANTCKTCRNSDGTGRTHIAKRARMPKMRPGGGSV
ncbi:hypothetical protein WJX72_001220 [[Myrmecia] bisecta]|uniref:Uncharacterized protein n=1 Tax=[Myrmecia] bisecta TaxID=41462 RepID=A0AAW1PFD0_9CHLO